MEVELRPILYLNTRKKVGGQHYTLTAIAAAKTGNFCSKSWVDLGSGLERHGKLDPPPLHRDSIPGPPSPWRVATKTPPCRPQSSA